MADTLKCTLCVLVTFYLTAAANSLTDSEFERLEADYSEYRKDNRIRDVGGKPTSNHRSTPVNKNFKQHNTAAMQENLFNVLGGTENWNRPQSETNLIGGDIIPPPGYDADGYPIESSFGVGSRMKRKAINANYFTNKYWDDGVLAWKIMEPQFDIADYVAFVRSRINQAIQEIENNSCVTFMEIPYADEWPIDKSLVLIQNAEDGKCASVIGQLPGMWQHMYLGEKCLRTGTIQHQFLHALGFTHEHQRPDRDDVVAVNVKYVKDSNNTDEFKKFPYPTVSTDTPYDLSSVMHYSLHEIDDIQTNKGTLELKDPHLAINSLDVGQREGISFLDQVAINKAYNCKRDCSLNCQNGGYVRKDRFECKCICPEGLQGEFCEKVQDCGDVIDIAVGQNHILFSHVGWNGTSKYPAGKKCYWLLKTSPGAVLNIDFESFDVVCNHNLEVRNFHITQPSIGMCGSSEPAPIDTRPSPTGNTMMVVMDTETGTTTATGFKAVVTAVKDGCLGDPCHGAPCEPIPGSTTEYKCLFPDYNLHCDFEEGALRNCDRIRFNAFYQTPDEYQIAFYAFKTKVREGHAVARSTFARDYLQVQRGVMSIIPHSLAGSEWCVHFKSSQNANNPMSLNIYLARNGQLNSPISTQSAKIRTLWDVQNIDIDGRDFSSVDMYEIVFEVLVNNTSTRLDRLRIDDIHLIRGQCPTGACYTFPCRDAECFEENSRAVCRYSEEDIHCDFESSENHCAGKVEFVGLLSPDDSADWTINSGSTTTDNTGPAGAFSGINYLYVESNFPTDVLERQQREAYFRLSPRRAGHWCFSFHYHMNGETVTHLQARLLIETFPSAGSGQMEGNTTVQDILTFTGQKGNQWQHFAANVDTTVYSSDVKIQVEIIAKGSAKYSDIAIDDLHYVKGPCDSVTPVDGTWSNWSDYGPCSATCGQGIQSRTRVCTGRANNGLDCVGSSSETRNCKVRACQKRSLCDGFEDYNNATDYGYVENGTFGAFSIQSGPPESYFDGPLTHTHIGKTGPNWASEGSQYLLFDSSKEVENHIIFVLDALPLDHGISADGRACLRFSYHTYGEGWLSGSVSLATYNETGLFTIWTHSNTENSHWQKVQLDVPPHQTSPPLAIEIYKQSNVKYQDFGLDELSLTTGTCASQIGEKICPQTNSPVGSLSCGFEEGDDCSWLQRNVPGNKFDWTIWHGPRKTKRTGPAEPSSGKNYIYAEASGSRTLNLARLSIQIDQNQGCLEFAYHMYGSSIGTLSVYQNPGQVQRFRRQRNQGNQWKNATVNIDFGNTSATQDKEIIIEYIKGRNAAGDAAIDDIRYSIGLC